MAAEHPGEVRLRVIPGRSVDPHANIRDPMRGGDHDVDRRFGGQAGGPQGVCTQVMYANSTVDAW